MTHFIRWRHDSDENGDLASRVLSGYELARKARIPLHVHHALLFISLKSLPVYYVKLPIFTCYGGCLHTKNMFFFPKLFRMQLQTNVKKFPTRTFYNKYWTRAKILSGARSHFWSTYWESLKRGNQADKFGCLKVSLWFNRFVSHNWQQTKQICHAKLTRLTWTSAYLARLRQILKVVLTVAVIDI